MHVPKKLKSGIFPLNFMGNRILKEGFKRYVFVFRRKLMAVFSTVQN